MMPLHVLFIPSCGNRRLIWFQLGSGSAERTWDSDFLFWQCMRRYVHVYSFEFMHVEDGICSCSCVCCSNKQQHKQILRPYSASRVSLIRERVRFIYICSCVWHSSFHDMLVGCASTLNDSQLQGVYISYRGTGGGLYLQYIILIQFCAWYW